MYACPRNTACYGQLFGRAVRKIRKEQEMSQEALAERAEFLIEAAEERQGSALLFAGGSVLLLQDNTTDNKKQADKGSGGNGFSQQEVNKK